MSLAFSGWDYAEPCDRATLPGIRTPKVTARLDRQFAEQRAAIARQVRRLADMPAEVARSIVEALERRERDRPKRAKGRGKEKASKRGRYNWVRAKP